MALPAERIEGKIHTLRGLRVMLDSDLAGLYGVTTKRLNEQVSRNLPRFPDTFMFHLTPEEKEEVFAIGESPELNEVAPETQKILKSQNATSSLKQAKDAAFWGGRRTLPRCFTERGVLMVANVLKSDRAIEVSIEVIEAFVRLKHAILDHGELSKRIAAIELRLEGHDDQFKVFQELILPLLSVSQTTKRRIGFEGA